ncbi:MAG: kelch repeat-containing protein [Planctomycetota bacterium]
MFLVVLGTMAAGALPAQVTWERVPTLGQRLSVGLAEDPDRGRIVLFGGQDAAGADLGDTWEWDGTRWIQCQPLVSPPPRSGHAMAFDPVGRRVLLFGGQSNYTSLDDTWAWDGTNWQELRPASRPPARVEHAMAADPGRGQVALFGGRPAFGSALGDTWLWNGTDWQLRMVSPAPSARLGHGMAFHPGTGKIVLVGGVDARRWPWPLQVVGGPAGPSPAALVVGDRALDPPVLLDPLGMLGCTLYAAPAVVVPGMALGGVASWSLTLPADPSVVGETLALQAALVDPLANPAGVVMSEGLAATLGAR